MTVMELRDRTAAMAVTGKQTKRIPFSSSCPLESIASSIRQYMTFAVLLTGNPVNALGKGTQGGKNFSGGQKQRLTIARALAGKPKLLILDDSASALDFATDAALRKALREDTRGMTVVMVSQRASTIRHADRILVLDDGEMAGLGTHEELLETCPVYREICLSQLSAEEAAK